MWVPLYADDTKISNLEQVLLLGLQDGLHFLVAILRASYKVLHIIRLGIKEGRVPGL